MIQYKRAEKKGRITWQLIVKTKSEEIQLKCTHEELLKLITKEPEIQNIFNIPDSFILPQQMRQKCLSFTS